MKICSKCGVEKSIDQFYLRAGKPRAHCKSCNVSAFKRDKEAVKRASRSHHLRKSYGMTIDDFDKMVKDHEGKCAICSKELGDKLYIDHCHTTGNVRGLLCHGCNTGIGYFKDDISNLLNAIKYLKGGKE